MNRPARILLLVAALMLSACSRTQPALAPSGPHAGAVETLGWIMFIGGSLIFLLVLVLTAITIVVPQDRRRWLAHRNTVIVGGIAFPLVVLSVLLAYGFSVNRSLVNAGEPALRIEVVGEQWWWRVRYLDPAGEIRFVAANEIRIPVGQPVEFILKSADVIHSFWVPSLAGKLDMIPGRVNTYTFSAEEPGTYRGQCAEYCGAQHALMAFYVVAMEPDEFEAWARGQSRPASDPITPYLEEGRELLLANGCGADHL